MREKKGQITNNFRPDSEQERALNSQRKARSFLVLHQLVKVDWDQGESSPSKGRGLTLATALRWTFLRRWGILRANLIKKKRALELRQHLDWKKPRKSNKKIELP